LVTAHVRPRHWTTEPTLILIFMIAPVSLLRVSAG